MLQVDVDSLDQINRPLYDRHTVCLYSGVTLCALYSMFDLIDVSNDGTLNMDDIKQTRPPSNTTGPTDVKSQPRTEPSSFD